MVYMPYKPQNAPPLSWCECVWGGVRTWVWRPKVNDGCLFKWLSTLFFERGPFVEPENSPVWLGWLAVGMGSTGDSPAEPSPQFLCLSSYMSAPAHHCVGPPHRQVLVSDSSTVMGLEARKPTAVGAIVSLPALWAPW